MVSGLSLRVRAATVLLLVSLFLSSSCGPIAATPQVPALMVFGDSTADVGTNNHWPTLIRSNFAPYGQNFEGGRATGRFTDGTMVCDMLAAKLGLPFNLPYLDPAATGERLLEGVCFASAASGFLQSTSRILNVIPFSKQLMMFHEYQTKVISLVGRQRTSELMAESIFAISSGSNDFILSYLLSPRLQLEYTSTEWSTFVLSNQTQFLKQLYEAGARKFLMYGFPPLGCLPAIITLFGKGQVGCVEDKNQIAIAHNIRVHALFSQWRQDLPEIRILYGDAYTYIYDAFNNPSKYGYTETRRACCAEGLLSASVFCNAERRGTCADPSTYMFFDSVHPTESVYKDLAEEAWINMVPFFGLQN